MGLPTGNPAPPPSSLEPFRPNHSPSESPASPSPTYTRPTYPTGPHTGVESSPALHLVLTSTPHSCPGATKPHLCRPFFLSCTWKQTIALPTCPPSSHLTTSRQRSPRLCPPFPSLASVPHLCLTLGAPGAFSWTGQRSRGRSMELRRMCTRAVPGTPPPQSRSCTKSLS